MAVNNDSRLGCGRLIDDVWATADQPPSAHEQSCSHCQRARASLTALTSTTTALRTHDEQHLHPGSRVKSAVMQVVRAQVRRTQPLPLAIPEPGTAAELTISEQAVLAVVWTAADAAPGIRVRRCDLQLTPTSQHIGEPATVAVTLTIAMSTEVVRTTTIPVAGPQLHDRITQLVAAETGLHVHSLHLTVEDLYDA